MMKPWGELRVGDVIALDVKATVRITNVEQSPIAEGMRRFAYDVIEARTHDVCDVGVLVPADYDPTLSQS